MSSLEKNISFAKELDVKKIVVKKIALKGSAGHCVRVRMVERVSYDDEDTSLPKRKMSARVTFVTGERRDKNKFKIRFGFRYKALLKRTEEE